MSQNPPASSADPGPHDSKRSAGKWGVFISYRRGQTTGQARALHDRLEQKFGQGRVFMDVDSLTPGVEFEQKIQQAIGSCSVVVALIGRDWYSREGGQSTLDDPHDFVRLELLTALDRGVDVIPILVERTPMPQERELPEALRPLIRRQALELENARRDTDVKRLVHTLEEGSFGKRRDRTRRKRFILGAVAVLTVFFAALLIVLTLPKPLPKPTPRPSEQLRKLIPAEVLKGCLKPPKHFVVSQESAQLDCSGLANSPAEALVYELYPSHAAMANGYNEYLTKAGAIEGGVSCGDTFSTFVNKCETSTLNGAGVELGRIFQHYVRNPPGGGIVPVLITTVSKQNLILAFVGHPSDKGDDLVTYWNDGPNFIQRGS